MSYRQVEAKPAPAEGSDPYLESSVQRRLWALRSVKGWSRLHFAALLGVSGSTLEDWDRERVTATVPLVLRAVLLLDADLERTMFGAGGREAALAELVIPTVLSAAEVREWLVEHEVPPAGIEATERAIKGRQKPATSEWLTDFVATLDADGAPQTPMRGDRISRSRQPLSAEAAQRKASKAAENLRAARALAARHSAQITVERARAIGREASARRKRKPA